MSLPIWIGLFLGAGICFLIIGIQKYMYEQSLRVSLFANQKKSQDNDILLFIRRVSFTLNKPFAKLPYFSKLQDSADFLKIPFGALELLFIKESLAIGLGLLLAIFYLPLWGAIGAFVGFFIIDLLLASKVKAKKELIVQVLPETVDILDLCIGAGLDFITSIRWIIDKSGQNPFLEQLTIVINEIQMGKSRTEALKDMGRRLKIADISSFVRTIVQADRMGISIEEALRNLSEDTRMTRFQRGERYAIRASIKILMPLLFCILPVILIVVAGPIIIKFLEGGLIPGTGAGPAQ